MNVEKVALTKEVEAELLAMSARWASEESCYGYRANTPEDLKGLDVFLSRLGGDTAGFLLCRAYTQEKDSCTVPKGSRCLEIEELYIQPEHRSNGLGRALYQAAVDSYAGEVDYVTLGTATKNYKAILHFYIDELGMTFWSARLFQKTK